MTASSHQICSWPFSQDWTKGLALLGHLQSLSSPPLSSCLSLGPSLLVCVCVWELPDDRNVYHEPDGVRHFVKNLRGIGGYGRHPTTPQNGVQPRLIHRVDSHAHIVCQIFPDRRGKQKYMSAEKKEAPSFSSQSCALWCHSAASEKFNFLKKPSISWPFGNMFTQII